MKPPKYEPLKMGNKEFADKYGKRCMKYDKWKAEQERNQNLLFSDSVKKIGI